MWNSVWSVVIFWLIVGSVLVWSFHAFIVPQLFDTSFFRTTCDFKFALIVPDSSGSTIVNILVSAGTTTETTTTLGPTRFVGNESSSLSSVTEYIHWFETHSNFICFVNTNNTGVQLSNTLPVSFNTLAFLVPWCIVSCGCWIVWFVSSYIYVFGRSWLRTIGVWFGVLVPVVVLFPIILEGYVTQQQFDVLVIVMLEFVAVFNIGWVWAKFGCTATSTAVYAFSWLLVYGVGIPVMAYASHNAGVAIISVSLGIAVLLILCVYANHTIQKASNNNNTPLHPTRTVSTSSLASTSGSGSPSVPVSALSRTFRNYGYGNKNKNGNRRVHAAEEEEEEEEENANAQNTMVIELSHNHNFSTASTNTGGLILV